MFKRKKDKFKFLFMAMYETKIIIFMLYYSCKHQRIFLLFCKPRSVQKEQGLVSLQTAPRDGLKGGSQPTLVGAASQGAGTPRLPSLPW